MIGFNHVIVIMFGMAGLVLGGVLIDLDHSGSWRCKFNGIFNKNVNKLDTTCDVHRGMLHNPVVMLSIAMLSFCLGVGIMLHYIMDFIIIRGSP